MYGNNAVQRDKLGYGIADGASAIGISRAHMYELIKAGRVRVVKIGRRSIIPATELERLMAGDHAA